MSLFEELSRKACRLGVPLSVQLDLTWRCNEHCVHCYLDHKDCGELSTAEVKGLLEQLEQAKVFELLISGGEPLLRPDLFEILEYARALLFNVKLKTNAVLIGEQEAARFAELNLEQVQISIYSHRPEIHDAITRLPGSLESSLAATRLLKKQDVRVAFTNILMKQNLSDYQGVRELARNLGVECRFDPTVTPKLDGDRTPLDLRVSSEELKDIFHKQDLVGDVDEFCRPPLPVDSSVLEDYPCSAGHTACYVSPCGDVFPCIQFPLLSGNIRRQNFSDIWKDSPQLAEVRAVRARDLPVCSACVHVAGCERCPGLAYIEGDLRGISPLDCEKVNVRTGIPPGTRR